MHKARNCDGEGDPNFVVVVYGHEFNQCPINYIDEDDFKLVNFIRSIEGGGFGGGRLLPSVVLEETHYFFQVRSLVLSELHRIEKSKPKKKDGR